MINPIIVRIVLCLAINRAWGIRQLDVNNAFLNGHLTEEVYMAQLQGLHHADYPHHVCRLNKALFGLKQAPRTWYQELRSFLVSLGFVTSCVDTSLFIYSHDDALICFLVCVNDLIITGSDASLVDTIVRCLDSKFSTKDLGALSFFCGVEVRTTSTGLLLTQQKYVIDLLSKHNMLDSKPVSTPLAVGTSLSAHDGAA